MTDPVIQHIDTFTDEARLQALPLLQSLAAVLDGTPLDEDAVVLDGDDTTVVTWAAPGLSVQRISYAQFLEAMTTPRGLVLQSFHLPDTTVLLALYPYPDGYTPDEGADEQED